MLERFRVCLLDAANAGRHLVQIEALDDFPGLVDRHMCRPSEAKQFGDRDPGEFRERPQKREWWREEEEGVAAVAGSRRPGGRSRWSR